jgi:hypothetical protein
MLMLVAGCWSSKRLPRGRWAGPLGVESKLDEVLADR